MGRKSLQFTLALLFVFTANVLMAQRTVTGVIKDAGNKEALIGASVLVKGTTGGTITGIDGGFSLNIPSGKQTLVVSFIGFISKEVTVKGDQTSIGDVMLESDAVGLDEVSVIASVAVDRQTPVAVSNVSPIVIQEKLGTQEFPEILKSTPSVYATKQGGGFGDSRINVRGFNQRNVAVMINGVPVNDMENGWVYWSNWAGLADVTRSMQVQRGLSASKIALPSIGGTINILTKTTDAEQGGKLMFGTGNDGYQKYGVTLSTGLSDNGWAVTFSGSKTTGNGWVDGTWFESYSYFLNISKQLNENHLLSFSLFGAPQQHGQRSTRLKIDEWNRADRGLRYNADWGYRDGQVFNTRRNFYHKPQAILNHYWTINDQMTLSTAAYASIGTGGGTGALGTGAGKIYASGVDNEYRVSQLVDFDRIVAENQARAHQGSDAIIRASNNNHAWYGVLSYFTHEISDNLTYQVGIDGRYYRGEHYRDVVDLLGGQFYLDNNDVNHPNKIAKIGDKVAYHNDGLVGWMGAFAQVEYKMDNLSAYINLAGSNKSYQRIDYFQKLEGEQESDWYAFTGFSTKGGVNYNINENNNVFANAGYFEVQPDFDAVFQNNSNDNINTEANNEKVISLELGYGFRNSWANIKLNGYRTQWLDKTFTRGQTINGEYFAANILGIDAVHQGVELEAEFKPVKGMNVNVMGALNDWRWTNNVENVEIYNDDNELIYTANAYIKDVHVGDAAQKTAALNVGYEFENGLKVGLDYNIFADVYAAFDPLDRDTTEDDGSIADSWKLPDYQTVDFNVRYKFDFGKFKATMLGKVNNLLNEKYISDATDGTNHDWQSAYVYYGLGRTWSASFIVNF